MSDGYSVSKQSRQHTVIQGEISEESVQLNRSIVTYYGTKARSGVVTTGRAPAFSLIPSIKPITATCEEAPTLVLRERKWDGRPWGHLSPWQLPLTRVLPSDLTRHATRGGAALKQRLHEYRGLRQSNNQRNASTTKTLTRKQGL